MPRLSSLNIFPLAKRTVEKDMEFWFSILYFIIQKVNASLMVCTEVGTNKNSIVWMDNSRLPMVREQTGSV